MGLKGKNTMSKNKTVVAQEQIAHQYEYMQFIAKMNVCGAAAARVAAKLGCQQNEAYPQIAGMLEEMGYGTCCMCRGGG